MFGVKLPNEGDFSLSDLTLILLGAGKATRFGLQPKKQWLYSADKPLWLQVADHFSSLRDFNKIIIVSSGQEIGLMRHFAEYHYVEGGNSRQASLSNALEKVTTPFVLVSDIARCCLDEAMIKRVLDAREKQTASYQFCRSSTRSTSGTNR
jgi:2-C-methyl-D-erythritol 4-phosphate cytidylyltransferase/2-C-methyl-D-erythritol 2,4-cyclodiphosphate synthase